MKVRHALKIVLVLCLLISIIIPGLKISKTEAASSSFSTKLSTELKSYLKKTGGKVTIQYKDLSTGDVFQINGKSSGRAASTIKLPLALYVMEQASKGKINLNKTLTYKSYHYFGGSGIIQKKKVGTKFTIRQLVKYAMIYSDNIAFIMLKEYVGASNFQKYMNSIGGQYAYPRNGQTITSANDLTIYATELYQFSEKNKYGKELVGYLKETVYNTTIPRGIKGVPIAHKVGMIPASLIYNDVAIVYDKRPFVLAIMTQGIAYEKSQKVIADIAKIVYKHHKAKPSVKQPEKKPAVKTVTVKKGNVTVSKVYTGSKLIRINQSYPASKSIQYRFYLNSNKTINYAVKLEKKTQRITRYFQYYPKTYYGKHGGRIKYTFDTNSSGYITRATKREKGTNHVLAWYQYKSKTVFGKHANRISGIKLNVPIISQRPELPTGCEITAVTMMLQYKGVKVNKVTLAKKMPRHPSNPNKGYVGNPFTKRGWTIYPPALMGLVKKYAGSSVNLTGKSNAVIERQLVNNKPVVVLVSPMHGFTVHALTLTGYDQSNYYFNDCWTGKKQVKMSKKQFNRIWANQKKRAISY
ncbi:serine hydrolase [Bacillus rubiinfantis]|uniref:serine hydrolase n=1 Tax=Bacillus rubiinfantis TaxID=1499680 RepID=UPI0009E3C7CD|nr:serine hydrolase [Bacillus rubiinfantis]